MDGGPWYFSSSSVDYGVKSIFYFVMGPAEILILNCHDTRDTRHFVFISPHALSSAMNMKSDEYQRIYI